MRGPLYDEKRIIIFRDAASTIFLSYEKELIGETNCPPYILKTLEKIKECREQIIKELDKFDKNEIDGKRMKKEIVNKRLMLKNLH